MPAFLFYCFTIIFILYLCYVFMLLFCYSFNGIIFVIIFPLFIFPWEHDTFKTLCSGIRFSAAHMTENHSQRCALTKQPGVFMAICRGKIYYGHFSQKSKRLHSHSAESATELLYSMHLCENEMRFLVQYIYNV
jgi:hypothetical protein